MSRKAQKSRSSCGYQAPGSIRLDNDTNGRGVVDIGRRVAADNTEPLRRVIHPLSASSGKPHSAFLRRFSQSEGVLLLIMSLKSPCLANLSSKRSSKSLQGSQLSVEHISGELKDPNSSTNSQNSGDMMVERISKSGFLRSGNNSLNVVQRVSRRRTAISVSLRYHNSLCSIERSEDRSTLADGRNGSQRLPKSRAVMVRFSRVRAHAFSACRA